METNVVTIVNGVSIIACRQADDMMVPIKPVCEALGVAYESQVNKIKEHPIYASSISLRDMVAADGRMRQMLCLPIDEFPGWLFSINPNNVREEIRRDLISFQKMCNKALFNYFFGSLQKQNQRNKEEIEILERIGQLTNEKNEITGLLAAEKRKLAKIREDRLSNEPTLFN